MSKFVKVCVLRIDWYFWRIVHALLRPIIGEVITDDLSDKLFKVVPDPPRKIDGVSISVLLTAVFTVREGNGDRSYSVCATWSGRTDRDESDRLFPLPVTIMCPCKCKEIELYANLMCNWPKPSNINVTISDVPSGVTGRVLFLDI